MPTNYVKTGQTPEGRERRLRAFKHNSYLGFTSMTSRQMMVIMGAETTTDESKDLAAEILNLSSKLATSLKTRIDP